MITIEINAVVCLGLSVWVLKNVYVAAEKIGGLYPHLIYHYTDTYIKGMWFEGGR